MRLTRGCFWKKGGDGGIEKDSGMNCVRWRGRCVLMEEEAMKGVSTGGVVAVVLRGGWVCEGASTRCRARIIVTLVLSLANQRDCCVG